MEKTNAILVVNAGSSSLKFQIFSIEGDRVQGLHRGVIEGIGVRPRMAVKDAGGHPVCSGTWAPPNMPDLPAAIAEMTRWVRSRDDFRLRAIGHRIVHGGPRYNEAVRITPDILEELAAYQELAPLHQPNNLAPIRLAMQIAPHLPQIGCFDTAFHRSHGEETECYALPKRFFDDGVRRYGFHGLSYEYISQQMHQISPTLAAGRIIVAHLGSGASMCALRGGKSVESTMGFSALDGIPMATRPGQIDPGVVLYMLNHMGMNAAEVTDLLYHRAGLMGLSGISSDMRVLLASADERASLAVGHFVHRCGLHVGLLAAALGGIDGFVFTAGIGENSPDIRARIAQKLAWLGADIDPEANLSGAMRISTPASKVDILVVPTDEELVIARETLGVLRKSTGR